MTSPVTGVVILIRHGDRQGFYQSPTDYTASHTNLTVLGYLEELNSGAQLRSRYLDASSPLAIQGINTTVAESTQVLVQADAGGEGGVIVESANAFMQGLFPPFNDSITLANGTQVSWAGRAQLTPVQTIEPDESFVMEPWTQCSKFDDWTKSFYASADFKKQASAAHPFFDSLPESVVGNRPKTLVNAWNLFDFLNVEHIHNATLAPEITNDMLENALTWAEYHENGLFGGADPKQINSIAGRGILNPILNSLQRVANASDPLKLSVLAASYKPFFSLFNMFDMPELEGKLVDYASAMVFEFSDNRVSISFRNGSTTDLQSQTFMGDSSMGYGDFMTKFEPLQLRTLADWCNMCGETEARGCAALNALNGTGSGSRYSEATSTTGKHEVSPVVAGVIGALVSLAIAIVLMAGLAYFSGLTVVKRGKGYPRNRHLLAPDSTNTVHRQGNSVELTSDLDRKESHVL